MPSRANSRIYLAGNSAWSARTNKSAGMRHKMCAIKVNNIIYAAIKVKENVINGRNVKLTKLWRVKIEEN